MIAFILGFGLLGVGWLMREPSVRPIAAVGDAGALRTVRVTITPDQMQADPSYQDLVTGYFHLERDLVEPTRLANADPADGLCPPEPIKRPRVVIIALSEGPGVVCAKRWK